MEEFLRGKKRRITRSILTTTKSRRLTSGVTSLNLHPIDGEKKLRNRPNQQQKQQQQMHVIPISENPKIREITDLLLKQQKTPMQPGQNLICSIDPDTLNILLNHINQISPSGVSTTKPKLENRLDADELDINYDWEVDRAKLNEMPRCTCILRKEEVKIEESSPILKLEPLDQSSASTMLLNESVVMPMMMMASQPASYHTNYHPQAMINSSNKSEDDSATIIANTTAGNFHLPNLNSGSDLSTTMDLPHNDLNSETGYMEMWNMANAIEDSLIYF